MSASVTCPLGDDPSNVAAFMVRSVTGPSRAESNGVGARLEKARRSSVAVTVGGELEAVADPADRGDDRRGRRVLLDVGAQPLDVHVERLGVAEVVGAPDPVDQHVAGEHPAGVLDQQDSSSNSLRRRWTSSPRTNTRWRSGSTWMPPASRTPPRSADAVTACGEPGAAPACGAARRACGPRARAAGRAWSRSRPRRPRGRPPCRSRCPWP